MQDGRRRQRMLLGSRFLWRTPAGARGLWKRAPPKEIASFARIPAVLGKHLNASAETSAALVEDAVPGSAHKLLLVAEPLHSARQRRDSKRAKYMMGGFLSESILETHGPRKVENLLVYPAVGAVIAALYSCRSRHSPKKARNVITVSIYLAAFAGIWKSGVTFGLACVKFGRSFRLRRMDNRATLIRASLAGSCMVIGTIIITMADFAARDAAYVALIYSAVLAGVDAYGHKKWWQPRWWLPNSVLASIMITLGMLIVLLNEHALERGDQLRLPDAAELAGIKTSESSQTPSDGT